MGSGGVSVYQGWSLGVHAEPSNPIFLQQFNRCWPVQRLELVDQALCVFGDPQHPLPEGAALYSVPLGLPFLHL